MTGYDAANRLTAKTYPDTTSVSYTYDLANHLMQVVDPTGTYGFTFDGDGRLTNTSTSYSFLTSRTFTTAYGYDVAANRTSFTDPEGGSTAYVYDTLNRLQTLTPPVAIASGNFGFSYDALSRRTQMTRPNGVTTTYGYDSVSRLLSVLHKAGTTTLDGVLYTVDNAGNRTSRTPQPSGVATTYGYDNIYQLLSATQNGSATETYSYDAVGNRLSSSAGSYGYNNSNEMNTAPGATFTYDNNGNTLSKTDSTGTANYAWDFENRLTSVMLPGSGGTVQFSYDPFGRRIKKASVSATSIFAYDGDNLIEETNASGTAVARYSQGLNIDEPIAMLRGGATSFYHADGLGSITSLANASGSLAQTYAFDSFGKQMASSGSLTNPFQYTARESDIETGLYYSRARYYSPDSGRFANEDPVRSRTDFYSYTSNNPANLVDPFGLQDAASPWKVGWEWLTGRGPRVHHFTDGDPFTEKLRRHEHIQELIDDICSGRRPLAGSDPYVLAGLGGVPKYLRDYSTLVTGGLTGNLAVTYLGSYELRYSVNSKGVLDIQVFNPSTINSATHPPVLGYTKWWNNHIGKPLNNFFASGPLSEADQYFDFHENLKARGCACKGVN